MICVYCNYEHPWASENPPQPEDCARVRIEAAARHKRAAEVQENMARTARLRGHLYAARDEESERVPSQHSHVSRALRELQVQDRLDRAELRRLGFAPITEPADELPLAEHLRAWGAEEDRKR